MDEPPKKRRKTGAQQDYLFYVLSAGIGKARTDIFHKQIKILGGNFVTEFGLNIGQITHIIVDEKMDVARMCRILKVEKKEVKSKIVKSIWLSASIKNKSFIDSTDYELISCDANESAVDVPHSFGDKDENEVRSKESTDKQTVAKVGIMFQHYKTKEAVAADPGSDYDTSDDEPKDEAVGTMHSQKPLPKGSWVCAHSSHNPRPNLNKHITEKLEALAKTYENTNDKWRALGYSKAIIALKKHPKPITSWQEAKALHGVGEKLADKIWEICESGELRKLDELTSQDDIQTVNLFTGVWGAGATTARAWLAQGFRTLEDLRTKANLTRQQKIGLLYYDELLDRMQRSEAAEIESVVVSAVEAIDKDLIALACGSYRRGKATCGDVDVLVTHPDGKSHVGVFSILLKALHQSGFLTDDLVAQEDSGNQKKYLGVCKLPGPGRKHRRLDIIVVPFAEYACAIMYFTGSAHFNRSLRNLAGRMGMSLNEHSLNTGVVRKNGEKINKGTPLHTPTEASIFEHFGLKYREPTERDH